MSVRIVACALLALAIFVTPSMARAVEGPSYKFQRTDGARAFERAHKKVAKRFGAATAGRRLTSKGIRFKWVSDSGKRKHWGVRKATWPEVRKATARLRTRLATPVAPAIASSDQQWLAKVRQCESGGNYSIDTGNGFFGAYQFTNSSWAAVGGSGNPAAASPAEQDMRALKLRKLQGTGAWPNCG